MTTLTAASTQWATRPADERFYSLATLHDAAVRDRRLSETKSPLLKKRHELEAIVVDGAVQITSAQGRKAALTHWSFGQLATVASAPAGYLRTLPAELAATNINYGLQREAASDDRDLNLLMKVEGDALTLRAATSDSYARLWNTDITSRLLALESDHGWNPAPAAFDGSRGLYLGDRNLFAFLVDNDRRIFESAPGGGLSRGFFVANSEVGSDSFWLYTFLYNYICGNHMVWGARAVKEIRLRHVGRIEDKAFDGWVGSLKEYRDGAASEDEMKIKSAMAKTLGKDKNEVLDMLFGLKQPGLTRSMIGAAYDLAERRVDWYGAPNTAWGMAGGMTEIARDLPNADDRVALERVASKMMDTVAF